jgi:hypothetical protein
MAAMDSADAAIFRPIGLRDDVCMVLLLRRRALCDPRQGENTAPAGFGPVTVSC